MGHNKQTSADRKITLNGAKQKVAMKLILFLFAILFAISAAAEEKVGSNNLRMNLPEEDSAAIELQAEDAAEDDDDDDDDDDDAEMDDFMADDLGLERIALERYKKEADVDVARETRSLCKYCKYCKECKHCKLCKTSYCPGHSGCKYCKYCHHCSKCWMCKIFC